MPSERHVQVICENVTCACSGSPDECACIFRDDELSCCLCEADGYWIDFETGERLHGDEEHTREV